ncbi:hypothetical protein KPO98_004082 [Salmonella enterica]|nr:hypothetical protein [Salmonella enterica]
MHRTTDVTGHKALAVLRSFTADMREWGVTVSSEEKLMALAREYFVDDRNTLDGLLLYSSHYSFDFLGVTFRCRAARKIAGGLFTGFLLAISKQGRTEYSQLREQITVSLFYR